MEVFELSRIAAKCGGWKTSLDELISRARKSIIFDNLVIYTLAPESNQADVLYARAIGRGKSAEADVTWGSAIGSRVLAENKILLEVPKNLAEQDRLQRPYLLGIPVFISSRIASALVLIRFGGPEFTDNDQVFAVFLADLTASILRQKYLAEYSQMLESEKNTSKLQFDFINTISHELRSPLGFIKGYTTTLLRDDANWDSKTQIDFLQIIEREANNLTELIDNLLDSSRLQSGLMKFNFQVVRIDSLIRDEINRALLADPDLSIDLKCEPDIPTISGDARRLAQVFDNLLSNARKYAPQSPIQVNITHNLQSMIVNFSDHGPGIPKTYLPRIFTRFFRVPDNSLNEHGSGLGLSICKQIIELHNGTITVDSDENGTVFTIKLPINRDNNQNSGEVIL